MQVSHLRVLIDNRLPVDPLMSRIKPLLEGHIVGVEDDGL